MDDCAVPYPVTLFLFFMLVDLLWSVLGNLLLNSNNKIKLTEKRNLVKNGFQFLYKLHQDAPCTRLLVCYRCEEKNECVALCETVSINVAKCVSDLFKLIQNEFYYAVPVLFPICGSVHELELSKRAGSGFSNGNSNPPPPSPPDLSILIF